MSSGKIIFITILAGFLSVGAGILGHRLLNPPGAGGGQAALTPQPLQTRTTLPDFTLPDLKGRQTPSNRWAGKVLVLNFWATWCPPCLHEIPEFVKLQTELGDKGVQFVGIAMDDPEAVKAFAARESLNYPILLGDESSIKISRQLGNRLQGLPFSVVFDRRGKVVYTHVGELAGDTLRQKLAALL